MKKQPLGPCVTFFPQPATLIATRSGAGRPNLMMASWAGIVSKTPPTMGVSLHHSRQTYANIQESRCFSVNVVPAALVEAGDFCGISSGSDTDKLAAAGLEVEDSSNGIPVLRESPLSVECRLSREIVLGDYRLTLGEIVEVLADAAAFGPDGKGNAEAFDPLVYLGGLKEYWSLGHKQGDAYRCGLKYRK